MGVVEIGSASIQFAALREGHETVNAMERATTTMRKANVVRISVTPSRGIGAQRSQRPCARRERLTRRRAGEDNEGGSEVVPQEAGEFWSEDLTEAEKLRAQERFMVMDLGLANCGLRIPVRQKQGRSRVAHLTRNHLLSASGGLHLPHLRGTEGRLRESDQDHSGVCREPEIWIG